MRDLGLLGENIFSIWCHQVGLIPNPSIIDKTGWDFFVQFPISNNLSAKKLHQTAFECRVQVKATDKRDRKLAITISNLRQMVTAQMPTFYVFLEFDGKNEVQRAFVLHVDNEIIYSTLKKIHEIEQSDKDNNLNKRTITLKYDETHELKFLNGESLKEKLLGYIGENYSDYLKDKSKFLENCGFEDGYGILQFSLNGEDSIKKIIDVSLGLEEELDIENFVSINQRFGIPSKEPELQSRNAKLKLGMSFPKKGKIKFKEDKLSTGLTFDINFYTSPFSFREFRKFSKFRVIGEFFDLSCEPYQNKANYSFSLGDDSRWELNQLQKAIKLITLLSKDKYKTFFEIELENFETFSFTLNSKHIKRNLDVFDELLIKIFQICHQLKVHDEIHMSLKELYYYKDQIESFHTIITNFNKCDCGVEFLLNGDNSFNKNQVAHISVIACHLGNLKIGVILTVIGDIQVILDNKFRVASSKIHIEKVFTVTQKDKLINKNIREFIDILILKYEENYNVIYAWE